MKQCVKRGWLKTLRESKGFTQTQVAKFADISLDYYQRIEYGQRNPSPRIARKLAVMFDFPMERFYTPCGNDGMYSNTLKLL